jgi:aryl-alcohol dehydrogenase-like predicted oxidoreductase
MERRRIGRSKLEIAPLMFGGNVFGWTVDEATSFKLLDRCVEAGFSIDTADVYSRWVSGNKGGESETIIGNWLAKRGGRDKVIIATKVGNDMPNVGKGLSRAHVMRSVEDSLKRLRTDYIDLYQSHRDDPDTPVDEPLAAYQKLIEQGKVRVIGASNFSAARLSEALKAAGGGKLPRYECLQPHYNLYERADFERELEPLVLKEKVAVIPYYSLASGFLTGKYRSEADLGKSARGGGIKKMLDARGLRILKALDDVSARLKSRPGPVALAWLMARPSITAPIASATSLEQMEDLVAATRLKLDAEAIKQIDSASAP